MASYSIQGGTSRSYPGNKRAGGSSEYKSNNQAQDAGVDFVAQDKIWREYLSSERQIVKDWETNWGFLTKFDGKGEIKTEKELPEKLNMFSEEVPNTSSGAYGAHVESHLGQRLQNLEFQFYGHMRRKRTTDLVCY